MQCHKNRYKKNEIARTSFTCSEQRRKRRHSKLDLMNKFFTSRIISLSSFRQLSMTCPRYLKFSTNKRLQPAKLNTGKVLQITLCRLLRLKTMHTVFFVLKDIKISLAEDSNTFSRNCKSNHDGASNTISSAYASKLKLYQNNCSQC